MIQEVLKYTIISTVSSIFRFFQLLKHLCSVVLDAFDSSLLGVFDSNIDAVSKIVYFRRLQPKSGKTLIHFIIQEVVKCSIINTVSSIFQCLQLSTQHLNIYAASY